MEANKESGEECVTKGSFREAQQASIKLLLSPKNDTSFLGSMKEKSIKFDPTLKDQICGFYTTGGDSRSMRLDFDEKKKCHINVTDIKGKKYSIIWGSTQNYGKYQNLVGVFHENVMKNGLRPTIERWLKNQDFLKL